MSQKVQSVPNPRFSVAPLTTVAGSIVSRRRIKVPVTNVAPLFSGQRNSSSITTQNYAYWDIADNESFLDLSKLIIVMDLTFHCYKAIAPSFDQSSQALLFKVEIGTSQGLKIEEINNYNLWANAISQYTESAAHKEHNFLDRSDYAKIQGKASGLNHMIDSTYYAYGASAVTPETPTRIHLRLHHSSFLNNAKLLPLFLFRNGIRIQVYFESVYKAFCLQHTPDPISEVRIPILATSIEAFPANPGTNGPSSGIATEIATCWNKLNWAVCYGPWTYNSGIYNDNTNISPSYAGSAVIQNTVLPFLGSGGNSFQGPPIIGSRVNGTVVQRRCMNTILIRSGYYIKYIAPLIFGQTGSVRNRRRLVCIPVRFHHNGSQVYSGFLYQDWFNLPPVGHPAIANFNVNYTTTANTDLFATTNGNASVLNMYAINAGGRGTATPQCAPNDVKGSVAYASWFGACGGANGSSGPYISFFLTSYLPEGSLPYYNFPYPSATGKEEWFDAQVNLAWAQAEMTLNDRGIFFMDLDVSGTTFTTGSAVSYPVIAVTPSNQAAAYVHPLLSLWTVPNTNTSVYPNNAWTYDLKNLELITDLVKPSAVDFQNFQKAYMSPSGIPYKYKRLIYRKTSFKATTGMVNINMQVSVRSMSGILIVLQDPKCDQEAQDSTRYMLPCLSSFFRKGLTRAEVVVGGQQYPVYQLFFKPNYSTVTQYTDSHIPEVENFIGSTDMNPSVDKIKNKYTRNYASCGLFDAGLDKWFSLAYDATDNTGNGQASYQTAVTGQSVLYSDPLPPAWTHPFLDASGFVLAFSLQKDDMNGFSTGIDSSQSGAVNLNLYFQDAGWNAAKQNPFNENIDCHTFVVADAVFTKQNDADLVRY